MAFICYCLLKFEKGTNFVLLAGFADNFFFRGKADEEMIEENNGAGLGDQLNG